MPDDGRCFVIGPIGDQLADPGTEARIMYEESLSVYEEVIKAACISVGMSEPYRADEITETGEIPEQVFEALRDTEIVIAGLTGANANVMYELGVRHVTGRCTIQIGEKDRLPFDISTIRTIQFRRTAKGLIDARKALTDALRTAIDNGCRLTTAGRVMANRAATTDVGAFAVELATQGSLPEPSDTLVDDEPLGLLEVVSEIEERMPELDSRITRLSELILQVGSVMSDHGPRIQEAESNAHKISRLAVFAKDLEPVAREFDDETIEMQAAVDSLDLAVKAMLVLIETGLASEEAPGVLDSIEGLANSARIARDDGMVTFRDSIANVRDLSRQTRSVFRLLISTTDRNIAAFSAIADWKDGVDRVRRALTD